MLIDGVLDGKKSGGTWMVDRSSVLMRMRSDVRPGRPSSSKAGNQEEIAQRLRGIRAHELYMECREVLAGAYDAAVLDAAETEDERRFYLMVSDFFLQEMQRELVVREVY